MARFEPKLEQGGTVYQHLKKKLVGQGRLGKQIRISTKITNANGSQYKEMDFFNHNNYFYIPRRVMEGKDLLIIFKNLSMLIVQCLFYITHQSDPKQTSKIKGSKFQKKFPIKHDEFHQLHGRDVTRITLPMWKKWKPEKSACCIQHRYLPTAPTIQMEGAHDRNHEVASSVHVVGGKKTTYNVQTFLHITLSTDFRSNKQTHQV